MSLPDRRYPVSARGSTNRLMLGRSARWMGSRIRPVLFDAMQLGDDTSPKVRQQGAVRATTVMLGVGADGQGASGAAPWPTARRKVSGTALSSA